MIPPLHAWIVRAALLVLSLSATAHAQKVDLEARKATATLAFSNLLVRIEGEDSIGLAKGDYRVMLLEELRRQGFNAKGAENLVFGIDQSDDAAYALGGTIREAACRKVRTQVVACSIGIDWELLDVGSRRVVYRVRARYGQAQSTAHDPEHLSKALVLGALRRLIARPRFVAALKASQALEAAPSYEPATFETCARPASPLPAGAERALDSTVIVADERGHGSGVILSADGLVLTAAHVVRTESLTIKTRAGKEYRGFPIRLSRKHDVALIRFVGVPAGESLPCLPVSAAPASIGSELFVLGTPASEDLGFSVTRGIVSGVRDFEGLPFLQTDASVSPGNSGGPIVGTDGRLLAVVSWKVSGGAVEGIAFGVPIDSALKALGLSAGAATAPALAVPAAIAPDSQRAEDNDTPDPVVSLDPAGDAERARARARAEQDRAERERQARLQAIEDAEDERRQARIDAITPGYIAPLRWTGAILAGAGAMTVIATSASYDADNVTRSDFESLRLYNDIGWIAFGVGAAALVTSYILVPGDPGESRPRATLHVHPGAIAVSAHY